MQIVSRDGASAGHGRQYQKPPLSQVDTQLSLVHCQLRVAYHYTLSSQRSPCCETDGMLIVSMASNPYCPRKTAAVWLTLLAKVP